MPIPEKMNRRSMLHLGLGAGIGVLGTGFLPTTPAAGPFIDRDADGQVIVDTREMEGFPPLPFTMWKDAEAPHSVENLSTTETIRLIRVELKQ